MTYLAPAVRARQAIERSIIRAFAIQAINAGYFVSVWNGEETEVNSTRNIEKLMDGIMTTDEDRLGVHDRGGCGFNSRSRIGWVFLVYGNDGWDVISDYTTNLDTLGLMSDADRVSRELEC